MDSRSAAIICVITCLAGTVVGMGVPLEDSPEAIFDSDPDHELSEENIEGFSNLGENGSFPINSGMFRTTGVGNLVYSILGFVLGGTLLFVSLFDPTRKPVIKFFDDLFGQRSTRRRRDTEKGLESHVASAFDAFTAAVDKMEMISKIARK